MRLHVLAISVIAWSWPTAWKRQSPSVVGRAILIRPQMHLLALVERGNCITHSLKVSDWQIARWSCSSWRDLKQRNTLAWCHRRILYMRALRSCTCTLDIKTIIFQVQESNYNRSLNIKTSIALVGCLVGSILFLPCWLGSLFWGGRRRVSSVW
jgi:hypothetical protein